MQRAISDVLTRPPAIASENAIRTKLLWNNCLRPLADAVVDLLKEKGIAQ